MQLEARVAGGIEKLDRAAERAILVGLFDGEGMDPVPGEDAQVDLVAQGERGVRGVLHLLEGADLFVHGAFVAGQRHDLAERRRGLEKGLDIGAKRGDGVSERVFSADPGGDQLGFGEAVDTGEIALAHFGAQAAQASDFGWGRAQGLGHGTTPRSM